MKLLAISIASLTLLLTNPALAQTAPPAHFDIKSGKLLIYTDWDEDSKKTTGADVTVCATGDDDILIEYNGDAGAKHTLVQSNSKKIFDDKIAPSCTTVHFELFFNQSAVVSCPIPKDGVDKPSCKGDYWVTPNHHG